MVQNIADNHQHQGASGNSRNVIHTECQSSVLTLHPPASNQTTACSQDPSGNAAARNPSQNNNQHVVCTNVRCATVGDLIADDVNTAPPRDGNDAGLTAKVNPGARHDGRPAVAPAVSRWNLAEARVEAKWGAVDRCGRGEKREVDCVGARVGCVDVTRPRPTRPETTAAISVCPLQVGGLHRRRALFAEAVRRRRRLRPPRGQGAVWPPQRDGNRCRGSQSDTPNPPLQDTPASPSRRNRRTTTNC